jgi:hypothetical protein
MFLVAPPALTGAGTPANEAESSPSQRSTTMSVRIAEHVVTPPSSVVQVAASSEAQATSGMYGKLAPGSVMLYSAVVSAWPVPGGV